MGWTDEPDKSKYAAANGERFLVLERVDGAHPPPFTVVVNSEVKLKTRYREPAVR